MAHKVDSMMYSGEQPWHKLGTYVGDKNLTSKEAIVAAGLNWKVEKRPSYFYTPEQKPVRGEGFDIVRTDREISLGHTGDIFTPLQNEDAFKFMDEIVGQGRAVYHTAGSLAEGRKVWLLVDMKESAEIGKGDEVQNFCLLSNGHDGRTILDVCLTRVRVVCWNTLQEALNAKEKGLFFSFRHTRTIQQKAKNVQMALSAVSERFKKFIEAGKYLAGEKILSHQLDEFLFKLEMERANQREASLEKQFKDFRRTEKYRQLVGAFENSPGAGMDGAKGTLWGAVNAITYYYDHQAPAASPSPFRTRTKPG